MSLKPTTVPTKTLASSINASATSFTLNNILGWDGTALVAADFGSQAYCVFRNSARTQIEIMEFDPATIASASITITRRGLDFTGDLTTEVTANKLTWVKGDTFVDLGTDTPQLWQWVKEYVDGIAISGSPDATTTSKGIGELPTPAEVTSGAATGGTGGPLLVTPDALLASKYGQIVSAFTGVILPYASATPPTGFLACDGSAVSRTTYADLFAVTGTTYGVGDGSTTFNLPNLLGRFPLGYSASAPTKTFTFASRSSNTITVTGADNHAHNELQTGQAVLYDTTSGAITGLTDNTTYYLIRITSTSFQLATSVANANAGTAISLSSDGSGTQTFTITYTARPMGHTGGEETHALTDNEMPSHLHDVMLNSGGAGGNINLSTTSAVGQAQTAGAEYIATAGSDAAHNTMPLFTVVNYIIKT